MDERKLPTGPDGRTDAEQAAADETAAKYGSMREFLEGFIGVVEGTGEPNSQDCGRKFAEYVEQQYRRQCERRFGKAADAEPREPDR